MDFEKLKKQLYEFDALRDKDEIQEDVVERREPQYAESWQIGIDPNLYITLRNTGIRKPYQHQADAIELSLKGHDVVLESPTASGKTLSFATPMLDTLLRNPSPHALMIYPMKALAFDQLSQLSALCKPLGITIATYDGDTTRERKKEIQANLPHILLTNPEYLNNSLLAHRDTLWKKFLRNLHYIVIDEMHEYRGVFGSNMALSLRRFFLQLERLGASPQVFLSTATCANPKEHAQNLIGRNVKVISVGKVLLPQRHFLFVNLNIPDFQYWKIFQLRIEQAALAALAQGLRVLIFCPTKRFIGTTLINCHRKANELGFDKKHIDEFYSDLTPEKRRDILPRIKSGEIRVIFTTNALELGLDIGGLDGVILAGFPSNIMSAWQQVGRAGRGWDKDAFVLFYAMNDPIDSYFVKDINAFLNTPLDHLVADPNNEQLIEDHMASLIEETGGKLYPPDENVLGKTFYDKARQTNARPGRGITRGAIQYELSKKLRGGIGKSYALHYGTEKLGQVGAIRRFRELYPGAIFSIMGRRYVARHTEQGIELEDIAQYLRTDPHFVTRIYANPPFSGEAYDNIWEVYYGTVNININPTGYKLVDERSDKVLKRGDAWNSFNRYNLHSVWFSIPTTDDSSLGIGALENLLRLGARFVIPADHFDYSTWSEHRDGLLIYFYEIYQGGIGIARKLFEVWPTALKKGIDIAEDCICKKGCQRCIEPPKSWNMSGADIDKRAGIKLARQLLNAHRKGPDHKYRDGGMIPS